MNGAKSKVIVFGDDARAKMKAGVDTLANAVKVTLGPSGRTVAIDRDWGAPNITKDGVSVAKEIVLEDNFENMGCKMAMEVAGRTGYLAGDGTTTATVLIQAMVEKGLKALTGKYNPTYLKKGMDRVTAQIVDYIKERAIQMKDADGNIDLEMVKQIATISANNDGYIGGLIMEAIEKIGQDGVITVEPANGMETTIKIVEGQQFDQGFQSPYFINNDKGEVEMVNPIVLVTTERVNAMTDLIPFLEASQQQSRPILIIADDYDGQVIASLAVNKVQGRVSVCAVKAPAHGNRRREILEDIAITLGGKVLDATKGFTFQNADVRVILGTCEKAVITKDSTTLVGGMGDKAEITERIQSVETRLKVAESDYEVEKLQERLAKLKSGVCVIYVGGATTSEQGEKKDRIDDALAATKSAIEEGIVAGGGVTYIHALKHINIEGYDRDEEMGAQIVMDAIKVPLMQIVKNADGSPDVVVNKIIETADENYGYNARTMTYVDMLKDGVIDPAKVSRVAIENAVSAASMFLTTECAIVNSDKE